MKIDSICRVCLKNGKLRSLFGHRHEVINYSEMFRTCTSLAINESDGHPKHICNQCVKKLKSAFKFQLLSKESFKRVCDYLNETNISNEVKIESPKHDDLIPIESIKHERDDQNNNPDQNEDFDDELAFLNENVNTTSDTEEYQDNVKCEIDFESKLGENVDWTKEGHETRKYKDLEKAKIKHANKVKELLKCSYCDKKFKFRFALLSHEDTHFGLKRYFCELCNKAYRSEKQHRNMHKRGFKFKCDTCSKSFGTKTKLSLHLITHTTNRQIIVCGVDGCLKQFLSENGAQRHREKHSGERNFICHLCSKTFKDKYSLEGHLKIHNNDKKFQCSYCEKKFIQSGAKREHEKRHIKKKDYPCPQCDQHFYTPGVLKRHLLTHTKILSEACRFCLKRFSRKDNRRRHEMVMHNVASIEAVVTTNNN